MPRSKRVRTKALTKTNRKGRDQKEKLVEAIRESLLTFPHVYIFDYTDLRSSFLKDLRAQRMKDSRIFMGNNRIMAIALGRSREESQRPNLFKLSLFLKGSGGLLFTHLPKQTVKQFLQTDFIREDYARAGVVATREIVIPGGALEADKFPHSMHGQFTRLGLPVKLERGIIHVREDTKICSKGVPLTPESAQLLKCFKIQMARFQVKLTAHWTKGVARRIIQYPNMN